MKSDDRNIFLAIPEAVISCGELAFYAGDYNAQLSEPLGFFLVRPIKRIKVFHDVDGATSLRIAVVGFAEINTGKKIITRTFRSDDRFGTEVFQHDVLADIIPNVGDIHWEIDETIPASNYMHFHDIVDYRNLSKKETYDRLNAVYTKATQLTSSHDQKVYQKRK